MLARRLHSAHDSGDGSPLLSVTNPRSESPAAAAPHEPQAGSKSAEPETLDAAVALRKDADRAYSAIWPPQDWVRRLAGYLVGSRPQRGREVTTAGHPG